MSVADCIQCWESPCVCGYDYLAWSDKKLDDQINMLLSIRNLTPDQRLDEMRRLDEERRRRNR